MPPVTLHGPTPAAFAFPMHRAFRPIAGRKPGVLVGVAGLGVMAAAAFPCDAGCVMRVGMSTSATVHSVSAMLALVCMMAAPLALGASFTESDAERRVLRFSVVMGALTCIAFVSLMVGGPQSPWMGAYQRSFLLANGIWMAGLGVFIWRPNATVETAPAIQRP